MSHVRVNMILAGPLAGKDFKFGDYQFVNGELPLVGSPEDVAAHRKYLEASLNVHPEGAVPKAIPEPPKTPEGNGTAPEGDNRLRTVLLGLDPTNDEHWTQSGKPALAAVEAAYGSSAVTRADVEAAVPGLTRETAAAAK